MTALPPEKCTTLAWVPGPVSRFVDRDRALTPEVRQLLAAFREALDLPRPANRGDELKREQLIHARLSFVLGTLDYLIDTDHADVDVAISLRNLRNSIRYRPVNYTTEAGEGR